jgi:hypothetical protein
MSFHDDMERYRHEPYIEAPLSEDGPEAQDQPGQERFARLEEFCATEPVLSRLEGDFPSQDIAEPPLYGTLAEHQAYGTRLHRGLEELNAALCEAEEHLASPEPMATLDNIEQWRELIQAGQAHHLGADPFSHDCVAEDCYCLSCGGNRGERGYIPGGTGMPVTCSSDWHDEDAPGPGDHPRFTLHGTVTGLDDEVFDLDRMSEDERRGLVGEAMLLATVRRSVPGYGPEQGMTAFERAAVGARYLDERYPTWWRNVDTALIDQSSMALDVLGQVYGSFEAGLVDAGLILRPELSWTGGFVPLSGPDALALDTAWRDETYERIAAELRRREQAQQDRPWWRKLAGWLGERVFTPSRRLLPYALRYRLAQQAAIRKAAR